MAKKIEKKYRVDTHEYDITEVNALIDDKGKLIAASADLSDENFYAPEENELFFNTENAAQQCLASITPTDEEIKKVMNFIFFAPDKKIQEHNDALMPFAKEDTLLYKALCGKAYCYVRDNVTDYLPCSLIVRIRLLVRQRILNIDGISVSIDNVSHIKWGKDGDSCSLVLKDGTTVFCSRKEGYDLWLVELVFGGNDSGREFPNLHR